MSGTEQEKRLHCVCFTGHRPEKIRRSEEEIKSELTLQIEKAIEDGFHVFITGMARGVDIWAAQIVLGLKESGAKITLVCACPYDGFETKWSRAWQEQYRQVLAAADFVRYISDRYSLACFDVRNRWMVDHSSRVIAVYSGLKSGTKDTIDYANRKSVPVVQLKG